MRLPTEQQCLDYFKEYKVPQNILQHCLKVRKVAVFLTERLKESGITINLELVNCTALLHDLFKVVSIKELKPNKFHQYEHSEEEIAMWKQLREKYPGMHEGEVAFIFFKEDFPELAVLLREMSNLENKDSSWEKLIVNYADARVLRNNVVTLQERFKYLIEVYPAKTHLFKEYGLRLSQFETKIQEKINLPREQLKQVLENGR